MPHTANATSRALSLLAALLVVKVTLSIVGSYRAYFPPDFRRDFLLGRESYFFGAYGRAFYAHILTGPVTLLVGLILVNDRFRHRFPAWHRRLGKLQITSVVCLLAPSGLWMAAYAQTGAVAGAGFATLAICTALTALLGWRAAVRRRFDEHRRWMWRCCLLLCSAVVLRVIGGAATVADAGGAWIYPAAAWACWLVPLAAFEFREAIHRRARRRVSGPALPLAAEAA